MIIVEGIDRVGKTTLCNKLKNEGFKVFKHDSNKFKLSSMDNDNETDKIIKMHELCKMFNEDIVLDRGYWSDTVYGILERNYDAKKALDNFELVEECINDDTIILYVSPTDVKWSSERHGKDLKNHNLLFELLKDKTKCMMIECNFNLLDAAVRLVKSYANEMKERS